MDDAAETLAVAHARWETWEGEPADEVTLWETGRGVRIEGVLGAGAARYAIACDAAWRTREVRVESPGRPALRLAADGAGHWRRDALPAPELEGALDVDLTATPLTNTLPIRRLGLAEGEGRETLVAYVDLSTREVSLDRQRYTCLEAGLLYRFEQIATGFRADIETDERGLVVLYPSLFRRR